MIELDSPQTLIGYEVVTETGCLLGHVRRVEPGQSSKSWGIVLATTAFPWIPDLMISTYHLDSREIFVVGAERLVVAENAADSLGQLTIGLLERFGLIKPSWERDLLENYSPVKITHHDDFPDDEPPLELSSRKPTGPSPSPLASEESL